MDDMVKLRYIQIIDITNSVILVLDIILVYAVLVTRQHNPTVLSQSRLPRCHLKQHAGIQPNNTSVTFYVAVF